MNISRRNPKLYLVLVIVALLLALPATWIFAQTEGTIQACIRDGKLQSVGTNVTCKDNETSLEWAIQGPKGEQGPQGPPGQDGQDGVNGVTDVIMLESSASCGISCEFSVNCPSHHPIVVGGGWSSQAISQGYGSIFKNSPYKNGSYGSNQGWTLGVTVPGPLPVDYTVTYMCAAP